MNRKKLVVYLSVLLCIEIVLLFLSWQTTYFHNNYCVTSPDNLVSADVARNVAVGNGYRTNSISLYEVNLYDKKGWLSDGPPWKNTYRFPFPILCMAALFKIFGDSHFVANFVYPSLFHLLSMVALFVLSYLLFRDATVSLIASFLFITINELLYTAIRNRSDSADIFFFVISLIAFFLWTDRRKFSLLFILGLIVGVSFLNRFNEGAILFLTFPIVIYMRMRLNIKELAAYAVGFLIPIMPFLAYNMKTIGVPFFSSNSYFQFVHYSVVSKYMSTFWKLNYGIDVANPFTYVLSNPGDFFIRAFHYAVESALKPFIKFGGSFWLWIPVAFASVSMRTDSKMKDLGIIFMIISLLHIVLIAPLGLTVYYIQFLYVPLIILAAKTLYEWYVSSKGAESAVDYVRQVAHKLKLQRLFLFITVCTIPFSLYNRIPLRIYILISLFTVVVAAVCILKKHLRTLVILFSLIVLLSSVLYVTRDYANKFSFKAYTTNEPSELKRIENATSPKDIVLTTLFWNTAWFSRRPSIPVPEYPDEIYFLIRKYRLNVKMIYLSSVDVFIRYSSPSIPLSYYSYYRLFDKNLPIRGFRVDSSVKGNLLLYRDDDPLQDVMDTKMIDFGGIEGASHLVYGFSSPAELDGSTVCWIVRNNQRFPFANNKFGFFKDRKLIEYDIPDAEITFLREDTRPMKRMKFRVFSANPEDEMSLVLNSNLFSYEEKGAFLGTFSLRQGWNMVEVNPGGVRPREGLNKVSFWLKQKKGSLAFLPPKTALDGKPDGGSASGTLGVAFDKAFFE